MRGYLFHPLLLDWLDLILNKLKIIHFFNVSSGSYFNNSYCMSVIFRDHLLYYTTLNNGILRSNEIAVRKNIGMSVYIYMKLLSLSHSASFLLCFQVFVSQETKKIIKIALIYFNHLLGKCSFNQILTNILKVI
jgi:hypothetical protein